MTFAPLLGLVSAKPFKPFWMALADGRALPVDGFDCLNFAPDQSVLTLYVPDSDETEIVDLSLIVSLRFSEGSAAAVSE